MHDSDLVAAFDELTAIPSCPSPTISPRRTPLASLNHSMDCEHDSNESTAREHAGVRSGLWVQCENIPTLNSAPVRLSHYGEISTGVNVTVCSDSDDACCDYSNSSDSRDSDSHNDSGDSDIDNYDDGSNGLIITDAAAHDEARQHSTTPVASFNGVSGGMELRQPCTVPRQDVSVDQNKKSSTHKRHSKHSRRRSEKVGGEGSGREGTDKKKKKKRDNKEDKKDKKKKRKHSDGKEAPGESSSRQHKKRKHHKNDLSSQ